MSTWNEELNQLRAYYDKLREQAGELKSEINRVLNHVEEVAELTSARNALEAIVTELCQQELHQTRGTEPLEAILVQFDQAKVIPEPILAAMNNLQRLGTLATPPKSLTAQQVKDAFVALTTILHWYVIDYQQIVTSKVATLGLHANPYLGLEPFDYRTTHRFFGREAVTKDLSTQFEQFYHSDARFLAILGASGSGKSSVLQAGLLPQIRHQLPTMQILVTVPTQRPLEQLALDLARLVTDDNSPVAKAREFANELQAGQVVAAVAKVKAVEEEDEPEAEAQEESEALDQQTYRYDGLRRIADTLTKPLLLVIDQFEELYIQCPNPKEQAILIANLTAAVQDSGRQVMVIIVLRTDCLGETQTDPDFHRLVMGQSQTIGMLTEDELRLAIREPAKQAGQPLEIATIELLVEQTRGREGALPLLQLALQQIWAGLRQGQPVAETLTALKGVGGELASKAQAIYDELSPEEKTIARRAFLKMVQFGDNTHATRHRAYIADLVGSTETLAQVQSVLRQFAGPAARIVTLDYAQGQATVAITHEAWLDRWQTLTEWLQGSRDDWQFLTQLEAAAKLWAAEHRADRLLWHSPQVDYLRQFVQRAGTEMTALQMAFFHASESWLDYRKWLKRGAIAAVVVLLMTTTVITFRARHAEQVASQERQVAVQAQQLASQERDQAKQAESRALQQKEMAMDTLNLMTYNLTNELIKLPETKFIVARFWQANSEKVDKIYALDPKTPKAQRDQAVNLGKRGAVWWLLDNPQTALTSYEKALELYRSLAKANPEDKQAQQDLSLGYQQLSTSYQKLGDLQRQADNVQAALGNYEKKLELSKQEAATDPKDKELQRNLFTSYETVGEVQQQLGHSQDAVANYETALIIRQSLATAAPADIQAQRGLATGYHRLGELHWQQNNTEAAVANYEKELNLCQQLVTANPKDKQAQRDLASSYEGLGDVQKQLHKTQVAVAHYEKSLAIRQSLATADPKDGQAQRHLAISYGKLGDIQQDLKNFQAGLTHYEKHLEISKQLAAIDPKDRLAQRNLAISYERVGDIYWHLGKTQATLQNYEQTVELAKQLATVDPKDAQAPRYLALVLVKLGDLQRQLENTQAAVANYDQALTVLQSLSVTAPQPVQRDIFNIANKLGDLQERLKKPLEALKAYQLVVEVSQRFVATAPKNPQLQTELSASYLKLGNLQQQEGDLPAALATYEKELELSRQFAVARPKNTEAQRELAFSYERVGDLRLQLNHPQEARQVYQQEFDLLNRLLDANRNSEVMQRAVLISYYKLGQVQETLKNPQAALEFYRQALAIAERLAKDQTNEEAQGDVAALREVIEGIEKQTQQSK
jgi:tetratricopeptide (TPR) repeat protein